MVQAGERINLFDTISGSGEMRRSLLVILLVLSIGLSAGAQQTTPHRGRKAPLFALEDINGATVELKSALKKGPVLIDFWATWCVPCLEQLAVLQHTQAEYAAKGLTIFAISVDNQKSAARVKPYVKGRTYSFNVLLDPNSDVARLYYAQTLPTTVIIDREGFIVYSHTGYRKGDEREVKEIIDALLSP